MPRERRSNESGRIRGHYHRMEPETGYSLNLAINNRSSAYRNGSASLNRRRVAQM